MSDTKKKKKHEGRNDAEVVADGGSRGYKDFEYIERINSYYGFDYDEFDDIDDVIDKANYKISKRTRGRTLGWHPDDPGVLMDAPDDWFD